MILLQIAEINYNKVRNLFSKKLISEIWILVLCTGFPDAAYEVQNGETYSPVQSQGYGRAVLAAILIRFQTWQRCKSRNQV